MKVITARDRIRDIPDIWRQRYLTGGRVKEWIPTIEGDTHLVYNRLMALDYNTATAADIAEIIGNDSWVEDVLYCDECGIGYPELIQLVTLDENPAYQICADCLQKGVALIGSTP